MWFANAGLADGEVKLVSLDDGLGVVGGANAWNVSKMAPPVFIEMELSEHRPDGLVAGALRCGVLAISAEGRGEKFCITSETSLSK